MKGYTHRKPWMVEFVLFIGLGWWH
jgi:hypothetical protein